MRLNVRAHSEGPFAFIWESNKLEAGVVVMIWLKWKCWMCASQTDLVLFFRHRRRAAQWRAPAPRPRRRRPVPTTRRTTTSTICSVRKKPCVRQPNTCAQTLTRKLTRVERCSYVGFSLGNDVRNANICATRQARTERSTCSSTRTTWRSTRPRSTTRRTRASSTSTSASRTRRRRRSPAAPPRRRQQRRRRAGPRCGVARVAQNVS